MRIYYPLLFICLLSLLSFSVQTQEKANSAKQLITEILATPEFETHQEQPSLRYMGKPAKQKTSPTETSNINLDFWDFNFFSITAIATFFEWLLWIAIAILIGLFIYHAQYWLGKWRPKKLMPPQFTDIAKWKTRLAEKEAILPDNVPDQAWRLWQSGKWEEAVSLLYRGALAVLNNRDKLAVQISATEGECLRLVKRHHSAELSHYFAKLTRTWQKIAYAQRLPADEEVQQLCERWSDHFSASLEISE